MSPDPDPDTPVWHRRGRAAGGRRAIHFDRNCYQVKNIQNPKPTTLGQCYDDWYFCENCGPGEQQNTGGGAGNGHYPEPAGRRRAGGRLMPSEQEQQEAFLFDRDQLFEDALAAWGSEAQIVLAQEELAELDVELARDYRRRTDVEDVVDEIADVLIAANQLARIYGRESTQARIEYKLARLRRRVDDAEEGSD
ncbi:MAG: hypothetical protein U5J98_07105 [Halobacteriales archaeon]|nr:hypothetical protein [Halobacteriales archaeon]